MRRLILFLVLMAAGPAAAQDAKAPAACAAVSDANLPAELAGWRTRSALPAAAKAGDVGRAALSLGKGVDAGLLPSAQVAFPAPPKKAGAAASYGGLFAFDVAEAGDYRVSLSTPAWVEVARGTTPIASTAHARGPTCSTVHKGVVFPLTPGRYVVEVAGNAEPTVAVMVTRAP